MNLILPYPPSANRYWRHARGRTYLSEEAKAFKLAVGLRARAAKAPMLLEPVRIEVHAYRARRAGDLDNTLKVLCDALNGHLWMDDKQVVEIHAYRHEDKANPRVEVLVESAL